MEQVGGEPNSGTSVLDKQVRRVQLVTILGVEIDSQLRTCVGVMVAHALPTLGTVDPGLIDTAMGGDLKARRWLSSLRENLQKGTGVSSLTRQLLCPRTTREFDHIVAVREHRNAIRGQDVRPSVTTKLRALGGLGVRSPDRSTKLSDAIPSTVNHDDTTGSSAELPNGMPGARAVHEETSPQFVARALTIRIQNIVTVPHKDRAIVELRTRTGVGVGGMAKSPGDVNEDVVLGRLSCQR